MLEINSIKDRLIALEQEFEQRRREITQAVEKDLLAAIDAKKAELKKLKDEYAKLIGRSSGAKSTGKRQRLSRDEQAAAQKRLADFLRSKPEGSRMKDLVSLSGVGPVPTRRILMQIPGIHTEGARASMIYKLS
jgi:ABC-type nitrate/sulfonate/bicarbonate transport system substrate-binding protein